MDRKIHKWLSPNLNMEMEIVVYGYYGYGLLLFPTSASDYLEYERCDLIESIRGFINSGTLKAYSINSINSKSWLSKSITVAERAVCQQQYNRYIADEVIPFIYNNSNGPVPIVTTGASLGAFHAANTFFRRPDLFAGVIAMSGMYDLKEFCSGYYDDNVYFNSPVDYLSNIEDKNILSLLSSKNIIIACGQGAYEDPDESLKLSHILKAKNVQHWLDIWGHDMAHDWSTWKLMLPHFLENINI